MQTRHRILAALALLFTLASAPAAFTAEPEVASGPGAVAAADLGAAFHDSLMSQSAENMVMKMPPSAVEAGPGSAFLVVSGTFTPAGEKGAVNFSDITLEAVHLDETGNSALKSFPLADPGHIRKGVCQLFAVDREREDLTLYSEDDTAAAQLLGAGKNAAQPQAHLVIEGRMPLCLAFRVPKDLKAAYVLNLAGSRTALVPQS